MAWLLQHGCPNPPWIGLTSNISSRAALNAMPAFVADRIMMIEVLGSTSRGPLEVHERSKRSKHLFNSLTERYRPLYIRPVVSSTAVKRKVRLLEAAKAYPMLPWTHIATNRKCNLETFRKVACTCFGGHHSSGGRYKQNLHLAVAPAPMGQGQPPEHHTLWCATRSDNCEQVKSRSVLNFSMYFFPVWCYRSVALR